MKARLTLKVRPGARKTKFAGQYGEGWKLHVAAPPVDGKANQAIVWFLADLANVPAAGVRIVTGLTGSNKIVELEGIDSETLERAILEAHGHRSNSGSAAPRKA
jgi:uncharacterized protein YggU (UPF0235/DUF167 family)